MDRRNDDRLARPGRRQSDRRQATTDQRRVLLVGLDEAWRLLTAYLFEEAGYVAYAAADQRQAIAFSARLLPDVVVIAIDVSDALEILVQLAIPASTRDIPVVVLTSSLRSKDARRLRDAGGVTVLEHDTGVDELVGKADTLIAATPHVQRTLKRRLLDIQALAQFYPPDEEGQARLRRLIDRLQVAIVAVDEHGHCIAASLGATRLTGYTRGQLLAATIFDASFAGGQVSGARWQGFLTRQQYTGTTTLTTRAGEDLTVHAAAMAEILPGVHVAVLAAA